MAGKGREVAVVEHSHRGDGTRSAVDRLSGLGLGHGRWSTGADVLETIWFRHGAERPYPPGDAEGRRSRGVPHGALDRVPAGRSGRREGSRTDDGSAW